VLYILQRSAGIEQPRAAQEKLEAWFADPEGAEGAVVGRVQVEGGWVIDLVARTVGVVG